MTYDAKKNIADALAAAMQNFNGGKGISQAQLARDSGVPQPTISRTLSGISIPETATLARLVSALGHNVQLEKAIQSLIPVQAVASINEQEDTASGSARVVNSDDLPDLIPIKRVIFKLSAGISGYEVEYDTAEDRPPIFMGKRWFDQNGYRPDRMLAVKINGRSMEPRLFEGDLVIVNLDNRRLVDGQVVAANYEGELVIKRLKRDAGQWYLASDNQDKVIYGDKLCQGDCGIIGHVVYRQTEHL